MAYTQSTASLVAQLRADLLAVTDDQTRALTQAWVNAWNEVAPDLNTALLELLTSGDKVSRAQLLRSERLLKVLAVIRDQLDEISSAGAVRIVGDLDQVIDIAGSAQASVIDSQLPAQGRHLVDLQAWTSVDAGGVEAIVKRSTEQITSRFKPLSADADKAVRRELVRGYAAGANPRQTASRIVARTEGKFNGGLTRALAIARTETLDASRAGGHIGRMANADVLSGWAWHCELSPRSCTACISMDGTVFPLNDPGPNDHVNGRCTGVPVTKSWADLGFGDIPEPPSIRESGSEWFDGLSADEQRSILGPSRYEAWKAGSYPMSAWGRMQHNDGWRDSLQTTPAPQVHSGGRRAAS